MHATPLLYPVSAGPMSNTPMAAEQLVVVHMQVLVAAVTCSSMPAA
jgi:hypothetical protein